MDVYFDKYFYISEEGRKFVFNENNELVFDLKNQPYKNQFSNDYGTFQLLCVEEKENSFLSFYGENIDISTNLDQQIYQMIIYKNKVAKRLMSKNTYLKEMQDSTGLNVDMENLKFLI